MSAAPVKIDGFPNDVLQAMPIEQMSKYREACAKQLPHALRAHHFLILQERWIRFMRKPENLNIYNQISPRCKFNFYMHRSGDVNNCTFVAISESAIDDDVSWCSRHIRN